MSESQNSKNKDDMFPVDPKTRENDYSNSSIELSGESVFTGCETGKPNRNTETNNFEKISNNFQSALADSAKSYLQMKNTVSKQVRKALMEVITKAILTTERMKTTRMLKKISN